MDLTWNMELPRVVTKQRTVVLTVAKEATKQRTEVTEERMVPAREDTMLDRTVDTVELPREATRHLTVDTALKREDTKVMVLARAATKRLTADRTVDMVRPTDRTVDPTEVPMMLAREVTKQRTVDLTEECMVPAREDTEVVTVNPTAREDTKQRTVVMVDRMVPAREDTKLDRTVVTELPRVVTNRTA